MNPRWIACLCACVVAQSAPIVRTTTETDLRRALTLGTGVIELPPGRLVIQEALEIPEGSEHLELRGHPGGSTIVMGERFHGWAAIRAERIADLRLLNFQILGNRAALNSTVGLPPSDASFAAFYRDNGILIVGASGVHLSGLTIQKIRGFPVLVTGSSDVSIESLKISDSGTLNRNGRNNSTGGILLEEGTNRFRVRDCILRNVLGNAIWTHSEYPSARNRQGTISGNTIVQVARDAIQIGHAVHIRVEHNRGSDIGYPVEYVDAEEQANPVAIDTAGNVEDTNYVDNHFEDVNGHCIDLDGFHDGEVAGNSCINRKPLASYPSLHFGIVFANVNPDMTSSGIAVYRNYLEGFAWGGVFLIGSHNRIEHNQFLDMNRAHCSGDVTRARCNYAADQPDLLRSGIYLSNNGGRPIDTHDNVIRGNLITGFRMDQWCIEAAPQVDLARNTIEDNRCRAIKEP